MPLSHEQLDALRNLSRKEAGCAVGWVAIAPARTLTELGFAARTRSGWQITPAGQAILDEQADTLTLKRDLRLSPSNEAVT